MIDWPLDENIIRGNSLNNTFGMVRKNANGTPRAHQGWDFKAEIGTPCYAAGDGRVVNAGDHPQYGKYITLSLFEFPYFVFYAHLNEINIPEYSSVKVGIKLGSTGISGNAMGLDEKDHHLHFEVRTIPNPGKGLEGRVSPIELFKVCPLYEAIYRRNRDDGKSG